MRPLLLAALVVLACGCDAEAPATAPAPSPAAPTQGAEWRTEVWRGVAVDVPADWAYGAVPEPEGYGCTEVPFDVPQIARPVSQTDACLGSPDPTPQADSVWLGAGLPAGASDLGRGWVQETVVAEGTTVTVTSRDASFRQQVLASVAPQDLCAATLPSRPRPSGTADLRPDELVVCSYRRTETTIELTSAERVGRAAARGLVAAAAAGRTPLQGRACDLGGVGREWVVLRLEGERTAEYVVSFDRGCPELERRDGPDRRLTPALVEPWHRPVIKGTVQGTGALPRNLYPYFIGGLG